ncbi:hypothetical protein H4R18_005781 [Coemansia javaensis]|uniref:Uncharacterized protein n=1 Tax=Coemansia javaensis TaxID=2761396 RepID=A0A9W8H0U7_9FUNG|nr:hypothetical protein H4R18_005781 [Coemansia javaensis]
MASPQLRLQNAEVFVGLVGSQAAAQAGETSKYFAVAGRDGAAARVYVDGCTADAGRLAEVGGLARYVQHAVEGGTAALFVSGTGLTRGSDYGGRGLVAALCRAIDGSMAAHDPELSMTYAFVGVTDGRVVDLHRDCAVAGERVRGGLGALHHEVDDWEALAARLQRGASLPFVLSLRFESLRGAAPTSGQLCVADMGVVSWAPGAGADAAAAATAGGRLQQSALALAQLARLLGGGAVLAGATVPANALVDLTGEFLHGHSKTAFVMFLGTDEAAAADVAAAADLIPALRRLRAREAAAPVDRRVALFYEKARYYQAEKYRLQDELADAQDARDQAERDLDDVQRDFGEERDALAREVGHWRARSADLERALDALRAASAGAEADARWENARLVTEKLQLRDDLRRAEVDMAAAEDAQARLLDLHESLQGAYDSLDAVYAELVAAYRALKDRCAALADARAALERAADARAQDAARQIADLTARAAALARQDAARADDVARLEAQLHDQAQRARAAEARAAQLEAANAALAASHGAERQAAAAALAAQLEDRERQAAAELHAAQRAARRLEADNAALRRSVDQLSAAADAHHDADERRLQWERERDQLQRQLARLQTTAENAQRREAELREESESQWAAWEDEKTRAHQKYLRLKSRFRDAVEFAAGVQATLETTAAGELEPSAPAAAELEPPAPAAADAGPAEPEPAAPVNGRSHAAPAGPGSGSAASTRAARRPRRPRRPRYAGSGDDSNDSDYGAAQQPDNAAPAAAADSDDSEITFNPAVIAPAEPPPPPPPPPLPRRRLAPRVRKSARELDAELATRPARRPPAPAPAPASPPKRRRAAQTAAAQPEPEPEPEPQGPEPPKRRRRAAPAAAVQEPDPEPAAEPEPAADALKKKRRLNLSRMRNLLGLSAGAGAGAGAATAAAGAQAIKFAVPKIRATAAAQPEAADSD